uniref:Vitamin K-dependent gamma-carboxylase n=1 Tax=Megaselia scalaris TaxID=36166 RepID=T1GL29_MEGSC
MRHFKKVVESFTGHNWNHFHSLDNFILWLHRAVDASALGIFRFFFGLLMLIDVAEERGGSSLDVRYFQDGICQFPLFPFIRPMNVPQMGVVYGVIGLELLELCWDTDFESPALCTRFAIGISCYSTRLLGTITVTCLDCVVFCFSSIESLFSNDIPQKVPYWNYFLIKFQFFILYFIAGLKKLSVEWLSGYAMTNLGHHWIFSPFRIFFTVETTELIFIHWFAAIFDTSIAFLMIWEVSRNYVLPFMLSFHLMNSRLFEIGMFPWVCLAQVQLFYPRDWMKRKKSNEKIEICEKRNATPREKRTTLFIALYCGLQLFLPYSHFITKGYNNWTNGLYGYSWDMMVSSYDTIATSIKIIDNTNNEAHFLEPFAFTEYDRWTKYADMAKQYAQCISDKLTNTKDYGNPLKSGTYQYILIFQQRVFDPNVDILKAEWSPFKETKWVFPLLNQFNDMRPKIESLASNVYSWSNYSDVLFIADFPGLTIENFISTDLDNITIHVLEGKVEVHNGNETARNLISGESLKITSGQTHFVKTVSETPSTFLYTYINRTMLEMGNIEDFHADISKPNINPYKEFMERVDNYKKFLYNVGNSILFLIYKVPMPLRIREI